MRYISMLCVALGLSVSTPLAVLANNSQAYDRVMADAERVRTEARDVKQLLKDRNADLAFVRQRIESLDSHAQSMKTTLEEVDATNLSSTQHAALKRARSAADTLLAVLANKRGMLADPGKADKQRGLLRGKADAIAKRAEIVGQQVTILRG